MVEEATVVAIGVAAVVECTRVPCVVAACVAAAATSAAIAAACQARWLVAVAAHPLGRWRFTPRRWDRIGMATAPGRRLSAVPTMDRSLAAGRAEIGTTAIIRTMR